MKYKHLFFDLDDTVTPSRDLIKPEMEALLDELPHEIIIVSGSDNTQMRKQIPKAKIIQMGQNGNHAICHTEGELWRNELLSHHKESIHQHIKAIRELMDYAVPAEDDLIEDRGSQLSFSIYGHHAPKEEKRAIDPDFMKRRMYLEKIPFSHDEIEVTIGGTTCFDYYLKGMNKGKNVANLIEKKGWNKEECVYYGDAIFPGGNDETVVGVIETIAVTDHADTYQKLKELL